MAENSKKANSARHRILELFLLNVGSKVTKEQIAKVAKISEWARRVRELRDEFGYMILSHKDVPGQLKPGEYILQKAKPNPLAKQRKIGKDQWYRILNRDAHKCLSCGRQVGDKNPIDQNRTVKLVIDHVCPISIAEKKGIDPYSDDNLQTLCDICNEGKWNKFSGKIGEARPNLDALVRHAPVEEQRKIYETLKRIFK
jgi:5-methylcytosine-specific restriction endonuclease McrA